MPEIPQNERLIVVLGMARSGTTIFTYVLCRHPQIALFRDGPEAWLLENDCLPRRQADRIGRVTSLFPDAKYVVLKRPWQEEHAEWLHQHLPRARFIVLLREREGIKRSWATSGRWALCGRQQALTDPDACYDTYLNHAMRLPEVVGTERCRIIRYEQMLQEPNAVFEDLADWLGVERQFDSTPIGSGLHWRSELADEFPRGDALLDAQAITEPPLTARLANQPLDLAIILLTWHRPHLLVRTLNSLFNQLDVEPELKVFVAIANNGTDAATRDVIFQYANRFDRVLLLRENIGIGQAFDAAVPASIPARHVMFSEDDMEYRVPLSTYLEALHTLPNIGAASGYHSKHHPVIGEALSGNRRWLLKRVASTTHLIMTAERYQSFRPLSLASKRDFDWHMVRQAPQSFQKQGLQIAVLPGGALHIGADESTWSGRKHAEYTREELDQFTA